MEAKGDLRVRVKDTKVHVGLVASSAIRHMSAELGNWKFMRKRQRMSVVLR